MSESVQKRLTAAKNYLKSKKWFIDQGEEAIDDAAEIISRQPSHMDGFDLAKELEHECWICTSETVHALDGWESIARRCDKQEAEDLAKESEVAL